METNRELDSESGLMRGRKAKALRRAFREQHGRPPEGAALGGKVTRFVAHLPTPEEKAQRKMPRVFATLFEKVARPSEWRAFKNSHRTEATNGNARTTADGSGKEPTEGKSNFPASVSQESQ